jgi:DNA-binding response OmpR family regulator
MRHLEHRIIERSAQLHVVVLHDHTGPRVRNREADAERILCLVQQPVILEIRLLWRVSDRRRLVDHLPRTGRRAATDTIGDLVVDRDTRSVTRRGNPVELAPKEYDLLIALLDRNGGIVTRLDLLRRVWGYSSAAVTRTIDTHIAELRRKVEEDPSSPKLILTVRKVGYRLRRG